MKHGHTPPETPKRGTPKAGSSLSNILHTVQSGVAQGVGMPSLEELINQAAHLREGPNVVWKMENITEGKFNFLRITSTGQVFLDIIKPGVHFHRALQLDLGMDEISAIIRRVSEQEDWKKGPEGFLTLGDAQEALSDTILFDPKGKERPEAVYVFDRAMVLHHPRAGKRGLRLRWIGRHINPAEGQAQYQIHDTIQIEEF